MIPSHHVRSPPANPLIHSSNFIPNRKRPAAELDAADAPDHLVRIACLESEARSRQSKIEDLSLRLTTTMHDLERQRKERDAYGRTVKETTAMMAELERQLDESQRAREKAEATREDLERELGQVRGEVLVRDAKITELQEMAVARERMIEELEGQLAQSVAIRVPAEEVEVERRERRRAEKELEEVQALLAECRECMEEAVAKEDAERESSSSGSDERLHDKKVEELEARLAEKEIELEGMQERVMEAEFDLAEAGILRKKHDELHKALEDMIGENEALHKENCVLKKRKITTSAIEDEKNKFLNYKYFDEETQTDFYPEISGTSALSHHPPTSDEGCQTEVQLEQESKEAVANFKLMSAANEIMYQQMLQNREKYDSELDDQATAAADADRHWSNLLQQALSVREQTMECLARAVQKNQEMERRLARSKETTSELKERVKELEQERDEFVATVDALYERVGTSMWDDDDGEQMMGEHEDLDAMERELEDGEGGGFSEDE